MTTAEKIKKLAELFPSQSDFAEKVGVSQKTVSEWLSGKAPSIRNLFAISDAFGLPRSALTGSGKFDLTEIKADIPQTKKGGWIPPTREDVMDQLLAIRVDFLPVIIANQEKILRKLAVVEEWIQEQKKHPRNTPSPTSGAIAKKGK